MLIDLLDYFEDKYEILFQCCWNLL